MTDCNEQLQVHMYELKRILYDLLCYITASMTRLFFSFNFYFILFYFGGRLQGQRVYMKEWEMNGIGIHDGKSTKN